MDKNILPKEVSTNETKTNEAVLKNFKNITKSDMRTFQRLLKIAMNNNRRGNKTCPICGHVFTDFMERNNGEPLVSACVCPHCNSEYIIPFRIYVITDKPQDVKKAARNSIPHFIARELGYKYALMV